MRFDDMEADEAAVTALLENISELLTDAERAKLGEIAEQIAASNGEMLAVIVGAADRFGGDDPQKVLDARNAGARWFCLQSVPRTLESFNDVVKPAN